MHLAQDTLAKSARGDHAAFAEIVRENQAMVFGLACRFLRDRSLAEELAQEVFLELYRSLQTIKSPEHLTFWLRKVTSHRCIDHTRRRKNRPQVSLDDAPEPVSEPSAPDPFLSDKLRRLVAALPEAPRMVVLLRYQEDLEPSEIAGILDMPVNTVKSHLQRSLATLRGKLARCAGGVHT
jgi:RNA polymerase sigma-70 factor (ECF subfamily)